jgi:hypothetical protein
MIDNNVRKNDHVLKKEMASDEANKQKFKTY